MSEQSGERIVPVSIEDEMKTAYIDYSMSVIVSRALPDVRDGLKQFIEGFCLECKNLVLDQIALSESQLELLEMY